MLRGNTRKQHLMLTRKPVLALAQLYTKQVSQIGIEVVASAPGKARIHFTKNA